MNGTSSSRGIPPDPSPSSREIPRRPCDGSSRLRVQGGSSRRDLRADVGRHAERDAHPARNMSLSVLGSSGWRLLSGSNPRGIDRLAAVPSRTRRRHAGSPGLCDSEQRAEGPRARVGACPVPWSCPACRTTIMHNQADARPHAAKVYRCGICRLDLRFDALTDCMVILPFQTDDRLPPLRPATRGRVSALPAPRDRKPRERPKAS
jgi:hypothetical protein